MKPTKMEYVIIDVETTGLFPKGGDRIIEIAAVKLKDKKITATFESLINPLRDIPKEATYVNKITQEMVVSAPLCKDILPGITEFIGGACLVGHNIKFDMDFICYELALCGRRLNDVTPAFDTLKMAKALLPQLSSYGLGSVAQYFGVRTDTTHRALADVKITASVLNRLLDLAENQGINNFELLVKQFGVEKPNYKIEPLEQSSLF